MDITTNQTEVTRIIREYYEQLYANELDYLNAIYKLPETHKLPKLNLEEIENITILVINKEIESVSKNFPTKKGPGPVGFTGEFYQLSKEELTPILLEI